MNVQASPSSNRFHLPGILHIAMVDILHEVLPKLAVEIRSDPIHEVRTCNRHYKVKSLVFDRTM